MVLSSALAALGCGDDAGDGGSDCPELSGTFSVSGQCEAASCAVTQSGCSITLNCDDGQRYTGSATRTQARFSSGDVSCSAMIDGDGESEDLGLRSGSCSARSDGGATACEFEASCTSGACTAQSGGGGSGGGGNGDGDDDAGVAPQIDVALCAQCLADLCEEPMSTCDDIPECKVVVDCVVESACWFDDGACVTQACTTELSSATVESANATLRVQSCSLSSCAEACSFNGGGAIGSEPGCSDSCAYSNDGECDDRGEGSMYDACLFGTDCTDCGSRDGETQPSCSEDCQFTNDGECDDGGPGAVTNECRFSTDCLDCGPR